MADGVSESQTISWTSHNPLKFQELRALEIIGALDKQEILEACIEKRGNPELACTLPRRYAMGTRNLVLEARFSDGVRWVIKVHMLSLESPCGSINGRDPESENGETNKPSDNGSISSDNAGSRNSEESDEPEDPYDIFKTEFEAMEFIRYAILLSVTDKLNLPNSLRTEATPQFRSLHHIS